MQLFNHDSCFKLVKGDTNQNQTVMSFALHNFR